MPTASNLLPKVLKTPLRKWQVTRYSILDWHDAPLQGFYELTTPALSLYCQAIANRVSTRTATTLMYEALSVATADPHYQARYVFADTDDEARTVEIIRLFPTATAYLVAVDEHERGHGHLDTLV